MGLRSSSHPAMSDMRIEPPDTDCRFSDQKLMNSAEATPQRSRKLCVTLSLLWQLINVWFFINAVRDESNAAPKSKPMSHASALTFSHNVLPPPATVGSY